MFTDIAQDGMLTGVNLDATAALAEAVDTPVIASGGIGGAADLSALARKAATLGRGRIEGVIVGRALYDGRVTIKDALGALSTA